MRRFFIFGVFVFLMFGVLANDKLVGLSEEDFEDGERVVVKVGQNFGVRAMGGGLGRGVSYEVLDVGAGELGDLLARDDVVGIYSEYYIVASLGESVGIVNSNASNNLGVGSLNLTGYGQKVCVIDSGVNFSHPDLIGKNVSCVVDCYNKACVENCSVLDDHGHGTHVSGIIGASGGITGVAPNVSLIGVKILGSDGGGSGNINDLPNAVDYCVSVGADVISMSLGTVSLFDSACDGAGGLSGWRDSIDAAVGAGVDIVVSSGNEANLTHIAAPACLSNATPVGDTYDGDVGGVSWGDPIICTDSTTALDQIVCHANRNSLVKLFAPGAMINSTRNTGGYVELGGTSMAAPMVSGAIALLKQYLNASGQSKSPGEIEDILNDTGVVLNDSNYSNLTYSRIDVYEALISIDLTVPNVTLVSPANNHVNLSINQSFVCNATDWQLSNVTLKIWNSSGLYYNESKNLTGTRNSTNFSLTDMANGEYSWNCFVYDELGNLGNASNFSLTVGGIRVELNLPLNGSSTNSNDVNFSCTSVSDSSHELENVTFKIWNSSNLVFNESRNISGFDNVTNFSYVFSNEGDYYWNCFALNNNSNEGDGGNFSLTFDNASPVLSSLGIDTTTSSAVISWTTDELSNSSAWISNGVWSNSSDLVLSHSISISSLSASTSYNYVVISCDRAGNCENDSGSFVTDSVVVSSGGGGGSSTASQIKVYSAPMSLFANGGFSQALKKDDRINFDLNSGSHSLSILNVSNNSVEILVESDPVKLNLSIGENRTLNLSSPFYYDFYVKLNSIDNGNANLTIRKIYDLIEPKDEETNETIKGRDDVFHTTDEEKRDFDYLILVGFAIIVLIVVILLNRKEVKENKSSKGYGKNKKVKAKAKRAR